MSDKIKEMDDSNIQIANKVLSRLKNDVIFKNNKLIEGEEKNRNAKTPPVHLSIDGNLVAKSKLVINSMLNISKRVTRNLQKGGDGCGFTQTNSDEDTLNKRISNKPNYISIDGTIYKTA